MTDAPDTPEVVTPTGGTDVAKRDTRTLVIPDSEGLKRFLAAGGEVTIEDNPDQVSLDIIARILDSETADEVLRKQEASHARDWIGRPLVLRGLRFNESDYDEGHGFYALLDCVNPDGEPVLVTAGSANVMAQAWKLVELGAVPCPVMLVEADKATKRGYKPMQLVAAPKDF